MVAVLLSLSGCVTTSSVKSGNMATLAMKYDGLHERTHNKKLRKILNVNPARVPWCGYFLGYIAKKSGKVPPKGYPKARAWLNYGKKIDRKHVRPDDIVVVGNHVGIVVSVEKNGVYLVSGNHSNKVGKSLYTWNRISGIRR